MIKIEYKEWYDLCECLKKYTKCYGKFYLQLYPITDENLEKLQKEEIFNKYIRSGAFLWNDNNWIKCENPCLNVDGTFRNRNLISPIFYIVYLYIGKKIDKYYIDNRNKEIDVFYAGNLNKNIFHYKSEYNSFCKKTFELSNEYEYYIKTDIKNFFNSINLDKLAYLLLSNINNKEKNINLNETNYIINFFKFIGDGKLPQTEEGITSSYLATKIYLSEIDNKIYDFFSKNKKVINFKIIRYVDDLYIFFNCKEKIEYDEVYDYLITFLNNVLYEYNLNLNVNKTELKESEYLTEDIKHLSYLEDEYIHEDIEDIINIDVLLDFFNTILNTKNINKIKYNNILKEKFGTFDNHSENEIFNTILFSENTLICNKKVQNLILKIINSNKNFIYCDPKRITILILKTKNGKIIKAFLNILYCKKRKNDWNRYDKIAIEQYLLQRKFINKELKEKLGNKDNLFKYMSLFINSSWTDNLFASETQENFCFNIKDEDENRCFNLYSLYKFEEDKKNYDLKSSYFKSYFESITLILLARKNNKKVNFSIGYRCGSLQKTYKQILNTKEFNNIIEEICNIRNENDVNHSAGDVNKVYNNEHIDDLIRKLKELINNAIDMI